MIYLREVTRVDIGIINEWRNDRELQSHLTAPFRYINIETDENWFDDYLKKRNNNIRCAICLNHTKEIVGVVYLLNIDHVSRNADLGIMIGKKGHQDMGIGFAATKLMLDHAFNNLNLHRVYAAILEDNHRSINLGESLGFRKEGNLRESVFKDGKYYNQIIIGCLKHEYITKAPSVRNRLAQHEIKKITRYLGRRNYESAEACARRAITEYPDTSALPSLLSLLAKTLEEEGKKEEAEQIRRRLAEKFPDWEDKKE